MPPIGDADALGRLAAARSGYLATASPDAAPHVVPMTFAVVERTLYSAVDDKPKRSTRLRRISNLEANPAVSVLVDDWDEDWSRLWWVRADGRGRVVGGDERPRAVTALRRKYAQYVDHALDGVVLAVDIERVTGWTAA